MSDPHKASPRQAPLPEFSSGSAPKFVPEPAPMPMGGEATPATPVRQASPVKQVTQAPTSEPVPAPAPESVSDEATPSEPASLDFMKAARLGDDLSRLLSYGYRLPKNVLLSVQEAQQRYIGTMQNALRVMETLTASKLSVRWSLEEWRRVALGVEVAHRLVGEMIEAGNLYITDFRPLSRLLPVPVRRGGKRPRESWLEIKGRGNLGYDHEAALRWAIAAGVAFSRKHNLDRVHALHRLRLDPGQWEAAFYIATWRLYADSYGGGKLSGQAARYLRRLCATVAAWSAFLRHGLLSFNFSVGVLWLDKRGLYRMSLESDQAFSTVGRASQVLQLSIHKRNDVPASLDRLSIAMGKFVGVLDKALTQVWDIGPAMKAERAARVDHYWCHKPLAYPFYLGRIRGLMANLVVERGGSLDVTMNNSTQARWEFAVDMIHYRFDPLADLADILAQKDRVMSIRLKNIDDLKKLTLQGALPGAPVSEPNDPFWRKLVDDMISDYRSQPFPTREELSEAGLL